jgi:hypothetical protein
MTGAWCNKCTSGSKDQAVKVKTNTAESGKNRKTKMPSKNSK